MPYAWVFPDRVVAYKGINVFRVYKNDMKDNPREFWFSTSIHETSDNSEEIFDIRELKSYSKKLSTAEILKKAIDKKEIKRED